MLLGGKKKSIIRNSPGRSNKTSLRVENEGENDDDDNEEDVQGEDNNSGPEVEEEDSGLAMEVGDD